MPQHCTDGSGDETQPVCRRCQTAVLDMHGIIEAIASSETAADGFVVSCMRGIYGDKVAEKTKAELAAKKKSP